MADRTHQDAPALLTLRETAERMRVSERTVYRWVKDGRLTALSTPGGRLLRFRATDVDAALVETSAA